jgi:hypothetical protein
MQILASQARGIIRPWVIRHVLNELAKPALPLFRITDLGR